MTQCTVLGLDTLPWARTLVLRDRVNALMRVSGSGPHLSVATYVDALGDVLCVEWHVDDAGDLTAAPISLRHTFAHSMPVPPCPNSSVTSVPDRLGEYTITWPPPETQRARNVGLPAVHPEPAAPRGVAYVSCEFVGRAAALARRNAPPAVHAMRNRMQECDE